MIAIKYLFLISAALLVLSCSQDTSVQVSGNDEKTIQNTIDPFTEIDATNAGEVTSYENTPESIVLYFFASKIRQDNAWEKVCLPPGERSDKFVRGLKEYETWTFNKYHFVSKEEFANDEWWVTVYMSLNFEGEQEDGTDQVTVSKINGTFYITEVPT